MASSFSLVVTVMYQLRVRADEAKGQAAKLSALRGTAYIVTRFASHDGTGQTHILSASSVTALTRTSGGPPIASWALGLWQVSSLGLAVHEVARAVVACGEPPVAAVAAEAGLGCRAFS